MVALACMKQVISQSEQVGWEWCIAMTENIASWNYIVRVFHVWNLMKWNEITNQLTSKYKAYGNRRFNIIHTQALHLSLIFSQMDPVPTFDSYFWKTHPNVIIHLCLCVHSDLLPLGFPFRFLEEFLLTSILTIWPALLNRLGLIY